MLQKHVPFDEKGSIILSFSTSFSAFRDHAFVSHTEKQLATIGILSCFGVISPNLSRLSIAHF